MATTRPTTGVTTSDTAIPMGMADPDARYRTGNDYWMRDDKGPGPQVMAADTLTGDEVRNGADEKLGEITDIMLDVPTGRVAYAVMSVGGEVGKAVEFVKVAQRAPLRVIAILAAASRVAADRLQVALRVAADPHGRPRRRNRERTNARDLGCAREPVAVAVDVAKRVGGAFAPPSGIVRPTVAQRVYDQYGRAS